MSRGRYALGQEIPLSVLCVNGNGTPTAPTSAPSMDIWRGTTKFKEGLLLPSFDAGAVTGLFQRRLFLGIGWQTGHHTVIYRYTAGSFYGEVTEEFEVIPGGDENGAVIAAYWYEKPHAAFIVMQRDSGQLTKGRNPRL